MTCDYDLFVIGAGSGGVRAARVAASYGARVAIAEEFRYGGTCVIRGCIPKKILAYAAGFREEMEHASHYGWTINGASFDWKTLIRAKNREIDRLSKIYDQILERFAVTRYQGRATLLDAHTVAIGNDEFSAETVLLATGGHPFLPPLPGQEYLKTSNEVFELETLPEKISVIGGGYIAAELASIFHELGRHVTLIYRRDLLLRGFDSDVREHVSASLAARGIDLKPSRQVEKVQSRASHYEVHLDSGESVASGLIVAATGRVPNTAGLGLESIGVDIGPRGQVVVDDYSRSSVSNIYAVGDCTDRIALTPIAIREGQAFADTVYGSTPTRAHFDLVPTAVFSNPQVASVGLSEHDARARFGAVDIYKSEFRPLKRTLTDDREQVLVKLVVTANEEAKVVGVHMVGPGAAEIIQAATICVAMGASKRDFDSTVALHPTTAEELVLMRQKFEPPLPTS